MVVGSIHSLFAHDFSLLGRPRMTKELGGNPSTLKNKENSNKRAKKSAAQEKAVERKWKSPRGKRKGFHGIGKGTRRTVKGGLEGKNVFDVFTRRVPK